MSRQLWYNRDGQPIDSATADALLQEEEYVRVALTRVTSYTSPGDSWLVSTQWLGLDRGWQTERQIFETMIIGPDIEDTWHGEMRRYANEADAKTGHDAMVTHLCQALTHINTVEHLNEWPKENQ